MTGMQPMKFVCRGIEYRVWHRDIQAYLGSAVVAPSAIEAVHAEVMRAASTTAIDVVEVLSSGHVWVRWRDGTEPSGLGHWHVITSKPWPEGDPWPPVTACVRCGMPIEDAYTMTGIGPAHPRCAT